MRDCVSLYQKSLPVRRCKQFPVTDLIDSPAMAFTSFSPLFNYIGSYELHLEVALLDQVLRNDLDAVLYRCLSGIDVDLGLGWRLVRGRDAREFLDLTRSGLLVQSLGVSLLALLDACIDKDFDKGQRWLVLGVQLACQVSVCRVGRDERGDCQRGAGTEERGHLGDPSNVLLAVLGAEAEVLVESKSDVVAVETKGRLVLVEQVLFQCRRNGRLARGRQARQPDGGALLLEQRAALVVGDDALVEGDVGGHCFSKTTTEE